MRRAQRVVVVSLVLGVLGVGGWVLKPERMRQAPSYTWTSQSWYGDAASPRITKVEALLTVHRDAFFGVCVGKRAGMQLTEMSIGSPRLGRPHRSPDGTPPKPFPPDPPKPREAAISELQQSLRGDLGKSDPDEAVGLAGGVFTSADGTASVVYPWRGVLAVTGFVGPALLAAGVAGILIGVWMWRRTLKRFAGGVCGDCGYDLRLGERGAPCPECGWAERPG